MSENTASLDKTLPKQEIDEKLDKTQLLINTYQAAKINKLLDGTNFRIDLFENAKRKINSSSKGKNSKTKMPGYGEEGYGEDDGDLSDQDQFTPQSISSRKDEDMTPNELDSSLGRRTSRREKKPLTKVDLGYEEPKPLKGVKLVGSAKDVIRKWEDVLNNLKDEFCKVPDFTSKAAKFDQEIKKLREGQYKNTMMLGNSIRKYLNNMFTVSSQSQPISAKVGTFINKFEESFAVLDNKTLFEECKYEMIGSK